MATFVALAERRSCQWDTPPESASGGGAYCAAYCSFDELCGPRPGEAALGAADYLALAAVADALYLSGLPRLESRKRDEARRLVTLVDALDD